MRYFYLLFLCAFCAVARGQSTYTWNVASGSWTTASSWSPARTSPAANDILVFNGSVTPDAQATDVPKQTIGKLRIINNANVRLVGGGRIAATGTITRSSVNVTGTGTLFNTELRVGDLVYHGTLFTGEVSSIVSATSMAVTSAGTINPSASFSYCASLNLDDGSNTALDVTAGSTLTLGANAAEPLVLRVLSGSKGQVAGTVRMLYTRQRLQGVDSASVFIKSGGAVIADSSFSGNAFSLVGAGNTVIFEAGSSYEGGPAANPFALSAPLSKVFFDKGSRYYHTISSIPVISGRSFATFYFNSPSVITATQNALGSFDSLVIVQGRLNINQSGGVTSIHHLVVNNNSVFNLNAIGGNVNISGNIHTAAGAAVNLNGKFTSAPANINFQGTVQQKISGPGVIRIATTADSCVRIRVQNQSGLLLEKNLDLNAAIFDLDSGYLDLNTYTVTLGSATFHGRATRNKGIVKGPGTLTRWYTTHTVAAGDSSLFPVGSDTLSFPLWAYGTPSSGGTVSLTAFSADSSRFDFPVAYYDTATSAGVMVNSRLGHAWTLSTGNGLSGSDFSLRIGASVSAGQINDVPGVRVTLAGGIAPGMLSQDGSGTATNPVAGKSGITASQLNNTFYLGANSSVNPLPATFINVAAQHDGQSNHVLWSTASETNLARFEVEKATANGVFKSIGSVKAANTRSVNHYRFSDRDGGAAIYRIKAVNTDGTAEYSRTVAVVAGTTREQVLLFPNPVTDFVQIGNSNPASRITLYDYAGREIPATVTSRGIDMRELPAGIYFLHLTGDTGTDVVKFVKQD